MHTVTVKKYMLDECYGIDVNLVLIIMLLCFNLV